MALLVEWLIRIFRVDVFGAEAVIAIGTWVCAVLALATLGALIYVGVVQVRQWRREAHKQLMMNLLTTWENEAMLEARAIFASIIRTKGDIEISTTNKEQISKHQN